MAYDPQAFSVSASNFHLGSVLVGGSGWSLVPTLNPTTGEIAIALSSTMPISNTLSGSLVIIDFHQIGAPERAAPIGGAAPIELVTSVNPTGQQVVSTELEDAQGTFTLTLPTNDGIITLTPSPVTTVVGTAAVSGVTPALLQAETNPVGAPAATNTADSDPILDTAGAVEVNEPGTAGGSSATPEPATIHVSALAGRAPAAVQALSAPIIGVVFQFGILPAILVPAAGQHLTDQVFQTLGAGTINPTIYTTVKDVFERVMAGQLMLSPCADNVDSQWDEVYSDMDWQDIGLAGGRARRGGTADIAPPTMAQHAAAGPDALDWYFAQIADDAEQGTTD